MKRTTGFFGAAIGLAVMATSAQAEQNIRVATWNIANLWHVAGEYLRPGRDGGPGQIRQDTDYAAIRAVAEELKPDIIGLQEMGTPEAARIAFPEDKFELIFSARFDADLKEDPGKLNDPKKRDIYTALALRKGVVKVIEIKPISELSIKDSEGHPVRDGTAVLVEAGGKRFWAVSLHLKSGCPRVTDPYTYKNPSKPSAEEACAMLVRQAPILEDWIDAKEAESQDFVLLGDFNRVFDIGNEMIWAELDDRDPPTLDLFMVPFRQEIVCTGHSPDPDKSIDYVIANKRLWAAAIPSKAPKIDVPGANVSDHCPVFLDFSF
jgi:endonuclease/exonuclease/phosphatase family metal-dependent hydrolase